MLGEIDGAFQSVVQVHGLDSAAQLPRLAIQAQGLPGVTWVDRIGDYSRLLREYRIAMIQVLGASIMLIAVLLAWRYRRQAWRVLLPTLVAMLAVLAWLGWRGEPLQLFHVLGLHAVFLASFRGNRKLVCMTRWDPAEAAALVERERITTLSGTPRAAQASHRVAAPRRAPSSSVSTEQFLRHRWRWLQPGQAWRWASTVTSPAPEGLRAACCTARARPQRGDGHRQASLHRPHR